MTLLEKVQKALETEDLSALPDLEKQAKAELEPLLAQGQKNYAGMVLPLLQELKDKHDAKVRYLKSPEEFAPQPRILKKI